MEKKAQMSLSNLDELVTAVRSWRLKAAAGRTLPARGPAAPPRVGGERVGPVAPLSSPLVPMAGCHSVLAVARNLSIFFCIFFVITRQKKTFCPHQTKMRPSRAHVEAYSARARGQQFHTEPFQSARGADGRRFTKSCLQNAKRVGNAPMLLKNVQVYTIRPSYL